MSDSKLPPASRLKVFLSYSSSDAALAQRLGCDLHSQGIDVWLDQWELRVGEEFVQSIERGVDAADFVIVLLTPASVASGWVQREWNRKFCDELQSRRLSIVPVRAEPCEIPDFLAQRSHADIVGGGYQMGLTRLLEILYHHGDVRTGTAQAVAAISEAELDHNTLPIVVPIAIEVGANLIPIFEARQQGINRFNDVLIPKLWEELTAEFGFAFPGVSIRGNTADEALSGRAVILIDEVCELMLRIEPGRVMVDASLDRVAGLGLSGVEIRCAGLGRSLVGIDSCKRHIAAEAGLVTWDAAEYLCAELQGVLRRCAADFIDVDVAQALVESVHQEDLQARMTRATDWFDLTDVLRRLVAEHISIADIGAILRACITASPGERDGAELAELARHALNAQITARFSDNGGTVVVRTLASEIEALLLAALQRTSAGTCLALDSAVAERILAAIRRAITLDDADRASVPILTISRIRAYVRRLLQLEFPALEVLSYDDLLPGTALHAIGKIELQL